MKQVKRKRKIAPAAVTAPVAQITRSDAAENVAAVGVVAPVKSSAADYSLAATCTIREGAALKSALLALSDANQPVTLDVHAVERIDTAALQLLCAFVRDQRARGKRTHWMGAASAFTEAVDTLGLMQALGYAMESA
jgi:ABC-type transporter Mla MlaB component